MSSLAKANEEFILPYSKKLKLRNIPPVSLLLPQPAGGRLLKIEYNGKNK